MGAKLKGLIRYGALLALLVLGVLCCRGCAFLLGYEYEEVYTSPQGSNTIVVKYDFVSRPDVFKKGWLWDEKIWNYPNSGFMETVHFNVEWLSETQIQLEYDDIHDDYDERYLITIPD